VLVGEQSLKIRLSHLYQAPKWQTYVRGPAIDESASLAQVSSVKIIHSLCWILDEQLGFSKIVLFIVFELSI